MKFVYLRQDDIPESVNYKPLGEGVRLEVTRQELTEKGYTYLVAESSKIYN